MTTSWVVLTRGDRPAQLERALGSIRRQVGEHHIVLVVNGGQVPDIDLTDIDVLSIPQNLGVPGGRDRGLRHHDADVTFFLDDDAELLDPHTQQRTLRAFAERPTLAVAGLRLVDEDGCTARRHVPRLSSMGATRSGLVATFLGGAVAVRTEPYRRVGGYWVDLFYGHEELDLAWRLIDAGEDIGYLADERVFHPRTSIARHAEGWQLTGRNRVWIARRDLPTPVAQVHALLWLVLGAWRAPDHARRAYVAGWRDGWRHPVPREPIGWRTLGRLVRLGRPPVL